MPLHRIAKRAGSTNRKRIMIVSHRATATLETCLRSAHDVRASMSWTLGEIQKMLLAAEPLSKAEVQALLDGCARRVDELDALNRRERNRIDGKTYPDETDE